MNIAAIACTAVPPVQPLNLLEQAREHRHALSLLESQEMARRALTDALAEAQQALEFKDVVIREVHHRVKNTIQMAASLLALHARATPSEEVRWSLQASYGRLRLLAKVHELLYASSASTEEVSLPPLFQALGDALQQSFAEMSDRVQLRITSDPVELSADEAIPLALLANELITNAYKHAFPNRDAGRIEVRVTRDSPTHLTLLVGDNGTGFETGAASEPGGLGKSLIDAFVRQLHGELQMRSEQGTQVIVKFPSTAHPPEVAAQKAAS